MLDLLRYFLSDLVFYLGIIGGIFLFSPVISKKEKYAVRLAICGGTAFLMILALTFTTKWQLKVFDDNPIISSYVIIIDAIASLFVCYKTKPVRLVYSIIGGLMLMLVYMQPAKILRRFISVSSSSFLFIGVDFLSLILIYTSLYFLFIKRINREDNYNPGLGQTISLGVFAFVILAATSLEEIVVTYSKTAFLLLCLGEVILSCVITYTQYAGFLAYEKEKNTIVEQELIKKEQKQFEQHQQIISAMNIKCHDLKHQIRKLENTAVVDTAVIQELDKTAELYDSFVKTGNKTIDVILTEKSLRCDTLNIQMTCMLDGKAFANMSAYDLNSLFGNALDNAIDYLETVPEDKRYLSISCREMGSMIHVRIENYLEGKMQMNEEGFPVTQKDKLYHGFGIRSMRSIAEKYNGQLSVQINDNAFCLDVLFPLKPSNAED